MPRDVKQVEADTGQGFAPGSWSQIAYDRTKPNGRVIGIDLLAVSPPQGVEGVKGDFLSAKTQDRVRTLLQSGRRKPQSVGDETGGGMNAEETASVDAVNQDNKPDTALLLDVRSIRSCIYILTL